MERIYLHPNIFYRNFIKTVKSFSLKQNCQLSRRTESQNHTFGQHLLVPFTFKSTNMIALFINILPKFYQQLLSKITLFLTTESVPPFRIKCEMTIQLLILNVILLLNKVMLYICWSGV